MMIGRGEVLGDMGFEPKASPLPIIRIRCRQEDPRRRFIIPFPSAFSTSSEEVDLPYTANAILPQDIGRGVLRTNAEVDVFVALPAIDQLDDLPHSIGPPEADGNFPSLRIALAFDGESGHPIPQRSRRGQELQNPAGARLP
jgi:hypothetical protein